ncbi:dipeptidase [Desulfomarina profundi]|nr:dipeptidase [Desulfomarina profundi]
MSGDSSPLIYDGHNDLVLRLLEISESERYCLFFKGRQEGHLDLPRIKKGGFGGGFFALYISSRNKDDDDSGDMMGPEYDLPLPEEIPVHIALPTILAEVAVLSRLERESEGRIKICTTAAEVRHCFDAGTLAVVLHLEGAEAIDDEFCNLEVLFRAGLRSVGLVWSRPSRFGHGVPFRFPGSPDTGPGLTPLGRELVRECNRLNIVVDVSHLNEAGFWDVAKITDAPLVATHSNCHALSRHTRNLTDRQLAAIAESGGIVGVNFATAFIRADGQMREDTDLDDLLRHFDHLIEHVGIDGVGFGTDFDGAKIPAEIGNAAGLCQLRAAMRQHGYDEETMVKLCHGNWFRVLEATLKG